MYLNEANKHQRWLFKPYKSLYCSFFIHSSAASIERCRMLAFADAFFAHRIIYLVFIKLANLVRAEKNMSTYRWNVLTNVANIYMDAWRRQVSPDCKIKCLTLLNEISLSWNSSSLFLFTRIMYFFCCCSYFAFTPIIYKMVKSRLQVHNFYHEILWRLNILVSHSIALSLRTLYINVIMRIQERER